MADGLVSDPGSLVASMGELLLTRSLKVAAVLLGAVVLNRLVRWLLRRLVGGLEHRFVQNRLESLRAKTPRALLASTDPLPSLRRSQRAEMIGAAVANVASVAIWLVAAILVLHVLGLRLGPLLAGAGIAGLVLSLSALWRTPPGSRTRSILASNHRYGSAPCKGRSRKILTCSSRPRHSRDTWSLLRWCRPSARPAGRPCGWRPG